MATEKMLVCDALDERDFLQKKISDAIQAFQPCSVKRKMDKALQDGTTVEIFEEKVRREYQSITDMIARHKRINRALVLSNATTKIKIKSLDEEISIAEAISLRKVSGYGMNDTLIGVMSRAFDSAQTSYNRLLRNKDAMDEKYKDTLTGSGKSLSDDEVKNVEALTDGYAPEIIDPIGVATKIQDLTDKEALILKEIDSAIKVSNATTYVEF